jgi:hypothetical protein
MISVVSVMPYLVKSIFAMQVTSFVFGFRLTGNEPVPVFAGRFPPMLLQIPCKSVKDSLRAFHCLNENLLRKNCFAPHSKQFWRDFRCGGRSLADARRGQQSEKHPKGLL